jgi:hypothetical protein
MSLEKSAGPTSGTRRSSSTTRIDRAPRTNFDVSAYGMTVIDNTTTLSADAITISADAETVSADGVVVSTDVMTVIDNAEPAIDNARRAQVRDAMERYRKRRKCGPVAGLDGSQLREARRDPRRPRRRTHRLPLTRWRPCFGKRLQTIIDYNFGLAGCADPPRTGT